MNIKETLYRYKAYVLRVIDGDTIDVQVSLGFHITTHVRVRLAGIDAPEMRKSSKAGIDAKIWLEKRILYNFVYISSERESEAVNVSEVDSFGRWIAWIYTDIDDKSINEEIIKAGHAKPYARS